MAAGLVIKIAEVWQSQAGRDQRVDDATAGLRRPAAQLAQQRKIVIADVVPNQIVGARQMLESGGDLRGAEFVNPIVVVEIAGANAMNFRRGI
jgi:hypothetical protein